MKKTLSLLLVFALMLTLSVVGFAEEQTLTGSADGRNGPVEVTVVMDGDEIEGNNPKREHFKGKNKMRFPGTDEFTCGPNSWAKMDGRKRSFELLFAIHALPNWK